MLKYSNFMYFITNRADPEKDPRSEYDKERQYGTTESNRQIHRRSNKRRY